MKSPRLSSRVNILHLTVGPWKFLRAKTTWNTCIYYNHVLLLWVPILNTLLIKWKRKLFAWLCLRNISADSPSLFWFALYRYRVASKTLSGKCSVGCKLYHLTLKCCPQLQPEIAQTSIAMIASRSNKNVKKWIIRSLCKAIT